MIIIKEGRLQGKFLEKADYYKGKSVFSKLVMGVTKRVRAHQAGKYMRIADTHLDIGCGDGYFMKLSPCKCVYGLDSKYGDYFTGKLEFKSNTLDYVSMLAVIEHLNEAECSFKEVYRVLKPGGKFIITTPKKAGSFFIRIYAKHIDSLHTRYFNYADIKKLAEGLFTVKAHKSFLFGLNQIFCLEKI